MKNPLYFVVIGLMLGMGISFAILKFELLKQSQSFWIMLIAAISSMIIYGSVKIFARSRKLRS